MSVCTNSFAVNFRFVRMLTTLWKSIQPLLTSAFLKSDFSFPKYVKNGEFKKLIKQMLQKSVLQRLTKVAKIKLHPFFDFFDWNGLITFEIESPYLPKYKDFKDARLTPFVSFTQSDLTEWKADLYAKISEAQKQKNNAWFEEF